VQLLRSGVEEKPDSGAAARLEDWAQEAMSATPDPARSSGSPFWPVLAVVVLFALATVAVVVLARHDGHSSSFGRATRPAAQVRTVAPFHGVELSGSNVVTIRTGRGQAVVVYADRDLLDRVTTVVRSGRLLIGDTPGSVSSRSPMSVDISVPSVSMLLLTGSGTLSAHDVRSSKLAVVVSGSGVVEADGQAARLDVSVSGSGDAMVGGLVSRHATATLAGSGTIVLTATKSLTAWLTGSGSILYSGDPAEVATSAGDGIILPIAA
jgi:hypothetical protein